MIALRRLSSGKVSNVDYSGNNGITSIIIHLTYKKNPSQKAGDGREMWGRHVLKIIIKINSMNMRPAMIYVDTVAKVS